MMLSDQHNFEISLSTTLSSNVVEDIIKRQIEEHTGRKIVKITTNYDSNKFDGYHITFASETTSNSTYKSSKEFVEQRWHNR